jgi:hypothetical protein
MEVVPRRRAVGQQEDRVAAFGDGVGVDVGDLLDEALAGQSEGLGQARVQVGAAAQLAVRRLVGVGVTGLDRVEFGDRAVDVGAWSP